ncbi:MAG: hypothetical protein LBP59_13250 [Planctomycetaceae bacterium]|nr:hypothetical protein [Planctomycetaceae bacterium]
MRKLKNKFAAIKPNAFFVTKIRLQERGRLACYDPSNDFSLQKFKIKKKRFTD